MQFSFTKKDSRVPEDIIHKTAHRLSHVLEDLRGRQDHMGYRDHRDMVKLPFDTDLARASEEAALELHPERLKYIFVIGIGGSNLGTKAVYDAFFGFADILLPHRSPKVVFLDTVHSALLESLEASIRETRPAVEEIALVLITKSGTTTESIANFEIVFELLTNIFKKDITDRTIIITDGRSSLAENARKASMRVVAIPEQIGGRFSFLTPVGLVPLYLMNFDVNALLGGAAAMHSRCLLTDALENPAIASAATIFFHMQENDAALNSFFFEPQLESLGKWYRQLVAESIGKEKDREGRIVHTGIIPIVSIGSTDLHSMVQLYLGGPRNMFTSFIRTRNTLSTPATPATFLFSNILPHIENKSARDIMTAIYDGVIAAYRSEGLPFAEISLEDISPQMLGQFFQFKMMEVVLLGELLNVDVFDQPSVELYKTETRKRLISDKI